MSLSWQQNYEPETSSVSSLNIPLILEVKYIPELWVQDAGEDKANVYPLLGDRYILGRSSKSCDIVVRNPVVSPIHLSLSRDSTQHKPVFVIKDENSTNGIYSGRRRVNSLELRHGDILTLGPPELAASVRLQYVYKQDFIYEYCKKVEEFIGDDGEISFIKLEILNDLQKKLELTDDEARTVRLTVQGEVLRFLRRYRENLDRYRQVFSKCVDEQGYPLSETVKNDLNKLQKYYQLKNQDIAILEKEAEQEVQRLQGQQEQNEASKQQQQQSTPTSSILNIHSKVINQPQKILILAAIPDGLRLDREIREIEEAIRRATNRNLFEIRIITAIRPQDIRRAIAEEQPQIVHFCGHGLEDGSLLLEDSGGNNKPVHPEGLALLFKLHANYVKCVLLNTCHSEKTTIAISQYINYAIGMNQPIEDKAAIEFAKGFYDGLGYKNSDNKDLFQRAFDEGMVAIQMENLSQRLIPVFKKNFK